MDSGAIIEALKRLGVPHDVIAEAINRDRTAATKMLAGKRSVKLSEVEPLQRLVAEYEAAAGESETIRRARPMAEEFPDGLMADYCAVESLPTYAGAGGGGTGDDDRKFVLVPRAIVDELRASPQDLISIDIRGDSMEEDFFQGDQVLADRRDRSPAQPGPFVLWDGDGFVLKNIERIPRSSRLRVFSSNSRYREHEFEADEINILGRPVWVGRRV